MTHRPAKGQPWLSGLATWLTALILLAAAPKSHAGDALAPMLDHSDAGFKAVVDSAPIGSGDGRVHVIPSIAPYSVKNGETLTVTAVVRSQRPVASVTANLGGVATVTLQPNGRLGGVSTDRTTGIWTTEWVAAGLEELVYTASVTITDIDGHAWTDTSLTFSDPAAGNSTPGTTNYPNGGMARLVEPAQFALAEASIESAVIDTTAGYAYFGTFTTPGQIVKVALGTGSNPPTRVGAVTLNPGENLVRTAVIDTANGHAYFGTFTSPGRVVKVALGTGSNLPTRVGSLTLATGENQLASAVIDAATGHAYFGTSTTPGRVVKVALGSGSNPPTRVGAVTLNTGENLLRSAVIDVTNGHAYFGTRTSPGRVVKVALGSDSNPPIRVDALTLETGENNLESAVIDVTNGHAYFCTDTTPGRVVKVALGTGSAPPTRIDAVTLNPGEQSLAAAAIDVANGYLYTAGIGAPARVVKVALGSGNNAPTRVGVLTLDSGENNLKTALIDAANGHAYFSTGTSPSRVVKVALGAGSDLPTRIGAVTLDSGEFGGRTALIDPANGFAYFGTGNSPGRVVKVAMGSGSNAPIRIGAETLDTGENSLRSAVIDTANGYAYFGTDTSPGHVVKVALGSGSNPPTRIGAVTLDSGENFLVSAVIDPANGHAYFGTSTLPGRVIKIALGSGSNPPTRVGAVTLDTDENNLVSAVIDPANGHAYFGTNTSPGRVVKMALGSGSNPPTRLGSVILDSGENNLSSAVIDTANGHAYFGTSTSPGRVVKVALGVGTNPPTRLGSVTLDLGEDTLSSAVIDTANSHAYFGTATFNSRIVKVALGSGSNPPTRLGAIPLGSGENFIRSAVIDTATRSAYFATDFGSGFVVKVALSQRDALRATRFTIPESGSVDDMRLYSHAASGNVRLALYDNAEPKNLLWESGVVANTANNDTLVVPIASGTPSTLTIPAGTYWAAWQTDSTADIGSYTAGSSGDSFVFGQAFGAAPASLASGDITSTADLWTQWIVYTSIYTLTYSAGPNGSITGTTSQEVLDGQDGTPVTAVPDTGYTFIDWSDTSTANPRTDTNVTGNISVTANFADITPPTTSASAAAIQVGGDIIGTYTANDQGSGVASLELYVKEPAGLWTNAGAVTAGTWSYTPSQAGNAADGAYSFAVVATDNATNSSAIPSGSDPGQATVLYNDSANSSFTVTYDADGTASFPMTPTEVMQIALTGVTGPVTITVSRTVGDVAPAGFMAERLIDESLSITGDLAGASATITWNHAPASIDPPGFTATLDTVFQFSGATQTGQYPVTPSGNTIVIGPVTSFSDWYAGSNDATVADWTLLEH